MQLAADISEAGFGGGSPEKAEDDVKQVSG